MKDLSNPTNKGVESPIERFAEEHLGIKLLPFQIEIIGNWADGKTINYARRMGVATANEVIREYIKANIKPAPPTSPTDVKV